MDCRHLLHSDPYQFKSGRLSWVVFLPSVVKLWASAVVPLAASCDALLSVSYRES
jgi:hypothetical protein